MGTPPFDYDAAFGTSDSTTKDEPLQPNIPTFDWNAAFGGSPVQTSAQKFITSVQVSPYNPGLLAGTPVEAPAAPDEPLTPKRFVSDATLMKGEPKGTEAYRTGEGRADYLIRKQQEYLHSPQKIADDMRNTSTISAAPEGWDAFKQKLANTRIFTDRSLVEFDQGNDSGFSIGMPFAHPVETAKGLVLGLPHFVADLVRQPFLLAIDKLEPGSGYLLPEEREQYKREVVANYAGLIVGGAMGEVATEMRIGRDVLKTGVSKALTDEVAAKTVTAGELAAIGETVAAAHQAESSLLGKIQRGIIEGSTGGATTGFFAGRTDKERRDLAATYAILALPAGIAFEAGKSIIHGDAAGPNTQIADDARQLSLIRQVQDAASHNADDAVASFFALSTAGDLAQAIPHMHLDRPVIVQGVARAPEVVGTEAYATHLRPDGRYDVAYGLHNYGNDAPEVFHFGAYEGGPGNPDASITGPEGTWGEGLYFAKKEKGIEGIVPSIQFKSPKATEGELRAFQINPQAKLFNLEAPVDMALVGKIMGDIAPEGQALLRDSMRRGEFKTNQDLYDVMTRDFDFGELHGGARTATNEHLKAAGFDGIEDAREISIFPTRETALVAASRAVTEAHTKSSFGASGFFPEEVVSFLGKDYQHDNFIVGKDGNVETHVLRDADGNKIEVPAGSVQHGSDMLVNSIVLDKASAQNALFKKFKGFADAAGDKPFDQVVQEYMDKEGLRTNQYAAVRKFLSDRYGEQLRNEHLSPKEMVAYKRIVHELNAYQTKSGATLADQATANGMFVESYAGSLRVRDTKTGEILGRFQNVPDATQFVNSVVVDRTVDLTPGGGGGLPPDGINQGLMSVPPPAGGPQTATYNFIKDGVIGQMRDWFNTTALGTHITGMRAIMTSLDNQLGTELFAKIYSPLQIATQRKYGAMFKDMRRLSSTSKLARGLKMDELGAVTSSLETMAPDDMVKQGGLFKSRAFTDREIEGAQWFVEHQIDIKKAFTYRRALINLERKGRFASSLESDRIGAVRKLQASLNVDEAHVEAARIIGAVLAKNKPGELSIYGMLRLADGLMDGHVSPEKFMEKNNFTPQQRQLHDELKSHFSDLASTFDIPDEQQLGGYFAHLRNYKDNQVMVGPDGAPIFVSELLRTGELSEYDRDPINVMARYINMGYTDKFTAEHLDNAYSYLNKSMQKLVRDGKISPKEADHLNTLLTDNYINELRGVPHASTSFSERMFNGILNKLNVETSVSVRRDLVNTFLSLSSSAAIGFRPVQGIRDFHNLTSVYFSRFGPERTAKLFTIMHQVTPQQLIDAGIIKSFERGEGIPTAMAREGTTPTLSPVSVLTAQERLNNTLSGKTQPYREAIQRAADAGIKWGLQHNVYQWAHAASYLESSTRVLKELNKLSLGEYGKGAEAKQKAYDRLFLNSYDLPVAKEFDRMVTEGKFTEASDLLGRATSFETVSTFGLANHPAGWGTNTGRLFGQFGNWPVWARTTLARMLSRGTKAERARVAIRFGMTQGSLALASASLGLNLNSWYLPTAAPLFQAGQSLAAASQDYDDDVTKDMKQAAAAIVLGVPGSALFRGGPAFGVIGSAIEAGQGTQAGLNEGVRALSQAPLLAVPGSFLLRDIYEGVDMAQNGDSPVSAWLRAFGVRSTLDESLLNPGGR